MWTGLRHAMRFLIVDTAATAEKLQASLQQ
jgi:hypothetical protein